MANVNSLTSASSAASSLYGSRNILSGLASGLDTEAMIENSVSGYKTKITQLEQSQTKIQWKQDAYREIISLAANMNTKYSSYTSSTNLTSASFYSGAVSAVASGSYADAVSVSGTSGSAVEINEIQQLATSARYISSSNDPRWSNAVNNTTKSIDLGGQVKVNKSAGIVTLTYGENKNKTIQFEIGDLEKADNASQLITLVQSKLRGMTVTNNKGEKVSALDYFRIKPKDDGTTITIEAKDYKKDDDNDKWVADLQDVYIALERSSANGHTVQADTLEAGAAESEVTTLSYLNGKSISVNLNGQERKIDLSLSAANVGTLEGFAQYLEHQINKAFGIDAPEEPLMPMNEDGTLLEDRRGEDPAPVDPGDIPDAPSAAEFYSNGNFDSDAFQAAMSEYTNITLVRYMAAKSNYDAYQHSVSEWNAYDERYAAFLSTDQAEYNQNKLISVSLDGDSLKFDFNQSGNNTLNITSDFNNLLGLGSNGLDTRVDTKSIKLEDILGEGAEIEPLTINGVSITNDLTSTSTINDVLTAINNNSGKTGVTVTYSNINSQFVFSTTGTGGGQEIKLEGLAKALFGDPEGAEAENYTKGEDAVVKMTVNGVETTRTVSSNSLSIDGLKVTLKDTTPENTNAKITFGGSANSDKIVDTVKSFVADYNNLMSRLRTAFTTQPAKQSNGSSYEPLTENDRNTMSESAVKSYEEKAKQGLLFGDSDLSTMYNKLVSQLAKNSFNRSEMAEIGISTAFDRETGLTTLTLDENKLRASLDGGVEKVRSVFADTSYGVNDGLAGRIKSTLDAFASTSVSKPGILVSKAGTTLSSVSLLNNTLQKQISKVQEQIERWQTKMSNRIDYYTKQFSMLEQLMNTMNNQSSMLSGMMGG